MGTSTRHRLASRTSLVRESARTRAGFSLIEVAILSIFLLIAIGGLSGAVLSSMKLSRTTEESALADDAARMLAATLQTSNFADIFRTYNATAADDPGPGPAPGADFDVRGLAARPDDADGHVGRILFPTVTVAGVEHLREDVDDARLGMDGGRDLNGDGDAIDDVTNDYTALPVRILVEWTGAGGNRSYELDLFLVP